MSNVMMTIEQFPQWIIDQLEIRDDGYFSVGAYVKKHGYTLAAFRNNRSVMNHMGELNKERATLMKNPPVLLDVKRGRSGGTWGHVDLIPVVVSYVNPMDGVTLRSEIKPKEEVEVVEDTSALMLRDGLINMEWEGMTFEFRDDGYFNMTVAANEFGKDLSNFMRFEATIEYIQALENQRKNSSSVYSTELVDKISGSHTGTWAHPKLAVFFARWLDVSFSVACDAMIEDILTGVAKLDIQKPEQSATLALPDSHIKAVEFYLDQLKANETLASENKSLQEKNNYYRPIVEFVTVNEYFSRLGMYSGRGKATSLGRRAAKLARERGIELTKKQVVGENFTNEVYVYPLDLIEEAYGQL